MSDSVSPSASESPSESPSLSPSASESPSVSPSLSPSASASASASPSPAYLLDDLILDWESSSVSPSQSPSISPSISPSASASPSAGVSYITGSVCWGRVTGVIETNIRTFTGNWSGTGIIANAGDAELIALNAGEYMVSEMVETFVKVVELDQNHYDAGDNVTIQYRNGNTPANCDIDSWHTYSVPFLSLGYVRVRIESTL